MNIGCGKQTSLLELFAMMKACFEELGGKNIPNPVFVKERPGDILHSAADIAFAQKNLGFKPEVSVFDGLRLLIAQNFSDIMTH